MRHLFAIVSSFVLGSMGNPAAADELNDTFGRGTVILKSHSAHPANVGSTPPTATEADDEIVVSQETSAPAVESTDTATLIIEDVSSPAESADQEEPQATVSVASAAASEITETIPSEETPPVTDENPPIAVDTLDASPENTPTSELQDSFVAPEPVESAETTSAIAEEEAEDTEAEQAPASSNELQDTFLPEPSVMESPTSDSMDSVIEESQAPPSASYSIEESATSP